MSDVAEIVGALVMIATGLHVVIKYVFLRTSFLDEKKEGWILNALGFIVSHLSLLHGRKEDEKNSAP